MTLRIMPGSAFLEHWKPLLTHISIPTVFSQYILTCLIIITNNTRRIVSMEADHNHNIRQNLKLGVPVCASPWPREPVIAAAFINKRHHITAASSVSQVYLEGISWQSRLVTSLKEFTTISRSSWKMTSRNLNRSSPAIPANSASLCVVC